MFWRFNNMCTTNIDILLNEEVSYCCDILPLKASNKPVYLGYHASAADGRR